MALFLYDSLKAVGLQHHFDRLVSVGVQSLSHLIVLTLEDFPLLGIQTMQDRTKLFHLIQSLKMLDPQAPCVVAEGESDNTRASEGTIDHNAEWKNERGRDVSSLCRELDFSSESNPQSTNHSFRSGCTNSIGSGQIKVLTKSSSKQKSKTVSRSKPTEESTPLRKDKNCAQSVPTYQSNTSEYYYGLPQARAAETPNRRSEGEPRIWVYVRKRPLTSAEKKREEEVVVSTPDNKCVIVHESKEAVDLTHYVLQHRFYFDRVFGEDCSNEEVYLQTAYPLVQHMLSGGSATCFAYGQTGAGKTHTMLGSTLGGSGLYALAVRDIFTSLSNSPTLARLGVFVSFFEIYCGQLYDLLNHRRRLFAREDGQRTVHIAGLCHRRVNSVKSLLEVIQRGTGERSQGSSGVNPLSSRSHAMLQIQLRETQQCIYSRMWFVDLAGSERASDSGDPSRRSRFEGAEINQSLLALKECIRSLDQEQSHTPFRQSKLTQVLRDSFIGDSMTCMIANISPVYSATEHTLNTLRYADRVKELKSHGPQRSKRRNKNVPTSEQNSPQGLSWRSGDSRGFYSRGKSPPKQPKRNSVVPTTVPPIRAQGDCACLSSTPKDIRSSGERHVKRLFQLISPVESPQKQAMERKCRDSEKVIGRGRQSPTCTNERTNSIRELHDQEKRTHLKLYHQQLQQFAPLAAANQQTRVNASTTTSLRAKDKLSDSIVFLEENLGDYDAHVNQLEVGLPNCDTKLRFKHGNSSDLRDLSEGKTELSRKNTSESDGQSLHKLEKRQDVGAMFDSLSKMAKNSEKNGFNLEDNFGNHETLAKRPCTSRAPAERPLSPVANHSSSVLTLSALNCSHLQKSSPKYNEDDTKCCTSPQNMEAQILPVTRDESSLMEPICFSVLAINQQPATESSFCEKLQIDKNKKDKASVIPLFGGWESEESTEESYLEVPQAIGDMIPATFRFYSPQKAERRTLEAAEFVTDQNSQPTSAVSYTPTQSVQESNPNILKLRTANCLLSQMDTEPHPGHLRISSCSSNSGFTQFLKREERIPSQMCKSDNHSETHWHVVQAHIETLREMEVLSHREGTLMIQQPDMVFVEYVQQLEDIMRKKAECVQSMIVQLQLYLKSKHSSAHLNADTSLDQM